MILFRTDPFVPPSARGRFRPFRIAVAGLVPVAVLLVILPALLPAERFSHSFGSDGPRHRTDKILETSASSDGYVPAGETLRAYAGTADEFSSVRVTLTLDDSSVAGDTIPLSLRRSFRSFFFPEGEPAGDAPAWRVLAIDGKPYLFADESLYPFSGERAALSWSSAEDVLPMKDDAFSLFPKRDRTIGFRPGTLVTNRNRLYAIDTSGRRRPIPDGAIFEALGFRADRVIPIDDAELAIHKPGNPLTPASPQPDGSVFLDRDTGAYSVTEDGLRHALGPGTYRDILLRLTDPIEASGDALRNGPSCDLVRDILSRRTYRCTVRIGELASVPGGSFEFSITPGADIRIRDLSVVFRHDSGRDGLSRLLREAKDRFLRAYATDRNRTAL